MNKYAFIVILALLCQQVKAQVIGEVNVLDRDVFYIQYTPSRVGSDDFDYQRWSGKVNLPPIRQKKLSLFNTLGLDIHHFDYVDAGVGEGSEGLNNFYNVNYSLFTNYKLSDKWSLNALGAVYILSNLKGELEGDDIGANGNLFVERTFKRKKGGYFLLGLGVGYLTLNGATQVTPVMHLKARLNKTWSFVLGLPNAYVKWDLGQKHSLKALIDINDFSANLNGFSSNFTGLLTSNQTVFTVGSAGLEYNYWVKPSLGISLRATQAVWTDYEIRDANNTAIHSFDADVSSPIISVGVKFNPIRKLQNTLNPF